MSLLRIRNLMICYPDAAGPVKVVDGLNLDIAAGEILGLVGESGSGKTQTALAVLGLLDNRAICSGSVVFEGRDVIAEPAHLKNLRGRALGMIFQDPVASLNPCLNIAVQMMEPLLARGESREHARRLCDEVRSAGCRRADDRRDHRRETARRVVGQGLQSGVAAAIGRRDRSRRSSTLKLGFPKKPSPSAVCT